MKKVIRAVCAVLAVLFAASCFSIVTFAFAAGDVNGDGKVNAKDARLALRASARLETLGEEKKYSADVDSDGKVTAKDARKILRASASLDKLPYKKPYKAAGSKPVSAQPSPSSPGTGIYAWVKTGARVEQKQNLTYDGTVYTYSASEGSHACKMVKGQLYCAFASTSEIPPDAVAAGTVVTFKLKLSLTEKSDYAEGTFNAQARIRRDVPDLPLNSSTENKMILPGLDGADDCCSAFSHYNPIGDLPDVTETTVYYDFPAGSPGDRFGLYYASCGSETVWTYEWREVEKLPSNPQKPTGPADEPGKPDDTAGYIRTDVTGDELEKLKSDDYELLCAADFTTPEGGHAVFDDYKTIEFDVPEDIPEDELIDYMGMYFGENGVFWISPEPQALKEGKFRFKTLHFSLFGIGKPSENELIDIWSERAAAQNVTKRISEDEITPGLQQMIGDALNNAGLGANQYGGAIARFILSNDLKGEILTAAADGDMETLKTKVANGVGEYVLGKIFTGEDDSVVTGSLGDYAAAIKKSVKDGNVAEATLEIVKTIEGNMFPAVGYAQKFAGLVDKLADIWTDDMVEEQFKEFERMMDKEGRVSYDDWNAMAVKLRGALTRLNSRGVTDADLRAKFEQRYENKQEIEKKRKENMRLIARWRSNGLLGYDYWNGNAINMSTIDKINSLMSIREMLRNMLTVNGKFQKGKSYEFSTDDTFLNDAVTRWVQCGIADRNEFYEWLAKEGIVKPLPQPSDTGLDDSNPFGGGKITDVVEVDDSGLETLDTVPVLN